jgi:hypothetical protein
MRRIPLFSELSICSVNKDQDATAMTGAGAAIRGGKALGDRMLRGVSQAARACGSGMPVEKASEVY